MDDAFGKLQTLIADEFNIRPDQITRATTAEDIDGWDSISHGSLLIRIETAFGINLPDDEMFQVADVGTLFDQIAMRLKG